MNEATFGKLAEYGINDTLGISEASTFDLRCKFASHAAPLLFQNLGFSLFVRLFTRSYFCAQAEWQSEWIIMAVSSYVGRNS